MSPPPAAASCTSRVQSGSEAKVCLQSRPWLRAPQSPRIPIPIFFFPQHVHKAMYTSGRRAAPTQQEPKGPPTSVSSSDGDQLRAQELSDPGELGRPSTQENAQDLGLLVCRQR